jgi:hypothetical protein
MIVIDSNIPVAEVPRQRSEAKYPFECMKVGVSFFIPCDDESEHSTPSYRLANQLRALSWKYGKRLGWKFVTRTVDCGVRVWRVE